MLRYFYGSVRFRVFHNHPEVIINRIRSVAIINRIKKADSTHIEFCTVFRSKCAVIQSIEEMDAEYEIVSEKGIPVLISRYRKRLGLVIGGIIGVVFILVSSNMIWDISVSGNASVPEDDIKIRLSTLGIKEGAFKNKDVLEEIYNDFLIQEPRISWLSVNYNGTVANVEVDETELVPKRLDRNKNINIVSKHDGVIRRVDVFDGKAEVVAGDTVSKGELLISSFAETRKNGAFMRAARGNVWASTERYYEIVIAKDYSQREYKSDFFVERKLSFMGKDIPIYIPKRLKATAYEMKNIKNNVILFDKYKLPLTLTKIIRTEFVVSYIHIDKNDAEIKAENELSRRINIELADAKIISKEKIFEENEDEYIFIFKLECLENIAEPIEFVFE